LGEDVTSFMGWVFEELYGQKIVDKKIFNELKGFFEDIQSNAYGCRI